MSMNRKKNAALTSYGGKIEALMCDVSTECKGTVGNEDKEAGFGVHWKKGNISDRTGSFTKEG